MDNGMLSTKLQGESPPRLSGGNRQRGTEMIKRVGSIAIAMKSWRYAFIVCADGLRVWRSASASMSVLLRWAYSVISAMAISVSPGLRTRLSARPVAGRRVCQRQRGEVG